MFLIFFWVVLSIVTGYVARSIGRSIVKYFLLSLFFSPLVGLIILAIKGKGTEDEILDNNEHIFYCPDCNYSYGGLGGDKNCPKCGRILDESYVLSSTWKKLSYAEQDALKKEFAQGKHLRNGEREEIYARSVHKGSERSDADELRKYKELLDMGAITKEEYEKKKKQILGL